MVGLPLWGCGKAPKLLLLCCPSSVCPTECAWEQHLLSQSLALCRKGFLIKLEWDICFVLRALVRRNSKDLAQRPLFS